MTAQGPEGRVEVDGSPRNSPAHGVYNYLTRDGMLPAELLAAGRREAEGYGSLIISGEAMTARRRDDGFEVAGNVTDIQAQVIMAAAQGLAAAAAINADLIAEENRRAVEHARARDSAGA
jgi:hypothetical protein